MEPVVMALILGMVTVGDRALAVKGMALPSRIRLRIIRTWSMTLANTGYQPLGVLESGFFGVYKVTVVYVRN